MSDQERIEQAPENGAELEQPRHADLLSGGTLRVSSLELTEDGVTEELIAERERP